MPKSNKKNEKKQIGEGIYMSKNKYKEDGKLFYSIKISLSIFKNLDFNINLEGSKNIEIIGQQGLQKHIIVPFLEQDYEVAKLQLNKSWNMKTKFKFSVLYPSYEEQKKKLLEYEQVIEVLIKKNQQLQIYDYSKIPPLVLTKFIQINNLDFIDYDFLPINQSIGFQNDQILFKELECLVHWKSIEEIMAGYENEPDPVDVIYNKQITPNSINKGNIKNISCLTTIMCLAENQKFIKRLIKTQEPNDFGLFQVKLCNMGFWTLFSIDKFFPCEPKGKPLFGNIDFDEYWLLLIEKSLAKLYGNYLQLVQMTNPFVILTGCPYFVYQFSKDKNENEKIMKKMIESKKSKYIISLRVNQNHEICQQQKENIWYEFYVSRIEQFKNQTLFQIRNHWEQFEWTGNWSINNEMWTEELIQQIKPNFDEDEVSFWMDQNDLIENFQFCTITKAIGWHEIVMKGKFTSNIDRETQFQHFCSRWVYKITLEQKSLINIGIHQQNQEIYKMNEICPYIDIGLVVYKVQDDTFEIIQFQPHQFSREKFSEINLEKGVYYILPLSTGVCLKYNSENRKLDKLLLENIAIDLFSKLDIQLDGYLNFQELKSFHDFFNFEFSEEKYEILIKKYNLPNINVKEFKGLSEKGFKYYFMDILPKNDQEIIKFLDQIGYDKNGFSYRSRVFNFTLHSNSKISCITQDALIENIDLQINSLFIMSNGEQIKNKNFPENLLVFMYKNQQVNKKNFEQIICYIKFDQ